MSVDLDRLEELARAATEGPWAVDGMEGHQRHVRVVVGEKVYVGICRINAGVRRNDNAAFIAALNPATALELIEMARRSPTPQEGAER